MYYVENEKLKSTLGRIDYYLLDIKTKIQPNQKQGNEIEDTLFCLPPFTYDFITPLIIKLKRLKYDPFSSIQLEEACELAARIEETVYYILIEFIKIINGWNGAIQEEAIHKLKLLTDQVEEIKLD